MFSPCSLGAMCVYVFLEGDRYAPKGLLAQKTCHNVLFFQEATGMLRRLPGLELAIRGAVPAIEDAVFMDNIANSILVGPNQMGSLHGLLLEACRILDMQAPDLYIRQVGCTRNAA